MSTRITVYKQWNAKDKDEATYRIECVRETEEAAKIPEVVGELLGLIQRQPVKAQNNVATGYKVGPGHPPIRTIDFNAPATEDQMKYLFKEAGELLKTSEQAAITSYLIAVFDVSDLRQITRGMAADWFNRKDQTKQIS